MVKNVIQTEKKNKPEWLKVKLPTGQAYWDMKDIVDRNDLHTVCESAACPNRGECWSTGTATFMILGNICTRSCGFCNVITGRPTELDLDEPRRVADAINKLGLKYVVITSVNRDELADGGAGVWAETIRQVREKNPSAEIEVLIPDFMGEWKNLDIVLDARPDVLNHNIETVPRLYRTVRPQGKYQRSLELLQKAKDRGFTTKSGLMVGLGEQDEEVMQVLHDLKAHNVDLVTIGQYMQPTPRHLPVDRYVTPVSFKLFEIAGKQLEFRNIFSGPLVRSSYHAREQAGA
ncbi:MAG: lipoyl synthase [Candidatus Melainabacteria bacterium]|nr:lipoyl synthase [Candidatus Melainabacteria bacterium]